MSDDEYKKLMLSIEEISREIKRIETNNIFLLKVIVDMVVKDLIEQCDILGKLIEQIGLRISDIRKP